MPLVVADRVQETTTTTGTGTITLAGAVSGFRSFATIGNANTTYYCVTSGTAWEVGIGTYTSAGTTLARTTILASSAAGAAITLAGTSNVFCVYPAGKSVYTQADGSVGIGTDNPLQSFSAYDCVTLEISTSAGHDTSLLRLYEPGNGVDLRLAATGPNTIAIIGTYSTFPLVFYTDSIEAMRVTATGRLGIGTTSPATLLDVNGTATATTFSGAGQFSTLSAFSTVSGTGFSTYLASPPAIGGTTASTVRGTTITATTAFSGPLNGTVGATTPSTGAFTTLSASSTVSGTGFSTYLASPPAIGGTTASTVRGTTITATTAFSGPLNGTVGATTPSTGAFTTLSASSTVSGTGFSTYLASPPAIGGTAAAAGTFTTVTGRLTPSAGTATAGTAPLKFASGTNLTTAEAGAMEYDGENLYFSGEASQRGVVAASQFAILTSDYTTPLGTANVLKQAFNSTTNGALTLTLGSYLFECFLNLSSLSATSGTIAFGFGGTALGRFRYLAVANKTVATATTAVSTFSNTAAATVITTATTTTTGYASIRGSIVITTAGTIIPSIALSVAAANVVVTGSYFNLTPLGSSTVQTVGNWS